MITEIHSEGSRYVLLEAVGSGLTSTVYRAEKIDSRELSRQIVAVKVLHSENSVPILQKEFSALQSVDSPHCVRVLGWENLEGKAALVLEWVEGINLQELMETGYLSETVIYEILRQIEWGLRDLQNKGLHHGDLSPRNILIDNEGRVRLIDFGSVANQDNIFGTPQYLAPEIWNSEHSSLKTDLFALGLIFQDLREGLEKSPKSAALSKKRAIQNAQTNDPYLASDPQKRHFVNWNDPHPSTKSELRRRANEALALKKSFGQTLLAESPKFWLESLLKWHPKPLFFWTLIFLATGVFLLTIRHPLAPALKELPALHSEIAVRSLNWAEVFINGKRVGYTPTLGIRVTDGTHRLEVRTYSEQLEKKLHIAPNERLLILGTPLSNNRIKWHIEQESLKD